MSKGTTLQEKVTKFDTLLGKPEREDAKRKIKCPKCGSENVIKRGTYETKNGKVQRYECKECDLGRFNDKDNGFRKMENRPEIITLALDLYFKGLSYRKIADHLNQFYHLDAEHTTIYYWVKKYSKFLKNFADELIPEFSGEWQSDEMAVNVNGEYKWLWNTIDEETRFLLVSSLSEARESEDAKRIFQEAKEKAGKKPDKITTDRLQAYIEGYKKEFRTLSKPRTKHVRLKGGIEDGTTNLVERFHGTARERDKVMRALETNETGEVFFKGFQTFYNFLRPHMSLDGATPAEVAGLGFGESDRWMSLIRMASERNGKENPEVQDLNTQTKNVESPTN